MPALPRTFYARDADAVARDLVGRLLVRRTREGEAAVRLVETEAYFGPPGMNPGLQRRRDPRLRPLRGAGDPASHSFRGPTHRNRAMWGPPGHAYVYLIYGRNECMNVVTGVEGEPQAVLLRAGEPVRGVDLMRRRRPDVRDRDLARGPGNLCRALGVTRDDYGRDLTRPPLWLESGEPPRRLLRTPRVNVTAMRDVPLRFVDADSASVSGPKALRP